MRIKFERHFSHGVAAEGSPRREPWVGEENETSHGAAKDDWLSPRPGLGVFCVRFPRLTPWAIFHRCSAATSAIRSNLQKLKFARKNGNQNNLRVLGGVFG